MTSKRCPRCGSYMLRMWKKRVRYDRWRWVWFCLSCRHELEEDVE